MRSLGWGKAWAAALQSGLACTASGFQGKLAQRQPRVEIPLPDQGGALARLFPIKPWLLVSEEEETLRAPAVARQSFLGFSSRSLQKPHVRARRVRLVDLQELIVLEILDL